MGTKGHLLKVGSFAHALVLLPSLSQVLGHLEPGLPDGSESHTLMGTKGHPLEVAVGKADRLLAIRGGEKGCGSWVT